MKVIQIHQAVATLGVQVTTKVMTDVMIDFETFGNGSKACIVQIGACYFDRETGEIGKTFKRNVDAKTSVQHGSQIDADTVYWWLKQSAEAQASITSDNNRVTLWQAMYDLNMFLAGVEKIWSHATFDFVILSETFKMLDMKPLFSYRAARDIRTLMDLAKLDAKKFTREGVHHDGLADAIHQVKYCTEALQKIENHIK